MSQITDPRFFEAGHAIFTVSNACGEHYTYRIEKPAPEKPFFVSLLTGPDNSADYTYMGIYNPKDYKLYITRASKMHVDSTPVRVFMWAVQVVAEHRVLPPGYAIHHEGRCCRCGRRLTTPESIEQGIGPECSRLRGD
jgi:hypothetical protein